MASTPQWSAVASAIQPRDGDGGASDAAISSAVSLEGLSTDANSVTARPTQLAVPPIAVTSVCAGASSALPSDTCSHNAESDDDEPLLRQETMPPRRRRSPVTVVGGPDPSAAADAVALSAELFSGGMSGSQATARGSSSTDELNGRSTL